MASQYLGRNTMLVIVDGLWPSDEAVNHPEKWQMAPFNNDWASSILVSQDQVAIESVCFDILRTEYDGPEIEENRPNMGAVDDYLEQAADWNKWPEGVNYDPDNSGNFFTSLGVHEHWNNAKMKQYSGNLGKPNGIELITIPSHLAEMEKIVVKEATIVPTIDADESDACWEKSEWIAINQTWIPYGEELPSEDFSGHFKVSWNTDSNLLYFIVKIKDDVFVDGYQYPDGDYPDYDIVEVFIDEDRSGGLHVFDDNQDWGPNGENAFSYHIIPDHGPSGGETVTNFVVCDIAGTSWGDKQIPNYADHFPEFVLSKSGEYYIWEFSMKVYDSSYVHDNPEASRADLIQEKLMGLSMAYCDNDTPEDGRDHFFGSTWVPEEAYNDHWKDATGYGAIVLGENQSNDLKPPVSTALALDTITLVNLYEEFHTTIEGWFSDPDGQPLTYSINTSGNIINAQLDNQSLSVSASKKSLYPEKITIKVQDGTHTLSYPLLVLTPENYAPEKTQAALDTIVIQALDQELTYNLEEWFTDANSEDALEFSTESNHSALEISVNQSTLSLTAIGESNRSIALTLVVSDGLEQLSHMFIVEIDLETSIANLVEEILFSCYPNPVQSGIVNIQIQTMEGIGENVSIQMYDMSGKLLKTEIYPLVGDNFNQQIAVNPVPSGLFILKVISGKYIFSELMLKK